MEDEFEALEAARRRKKELTAMFKVLKTEYDAVKKEIDMRLERVKEMFKPREITEYLDTVKVEDSGEFSMDPYIQELNRPKRK